MHFPSHIYKAGYMEGLPLHICIFCYNSSYNHNGPAQTNKCKHYTITSPQEETEKINTHLAEVASPVVNKNDKSFYGAQILLRNIRRGPCKLEKCTSNIWKVLPNSPGSSFSIPSKEGCCVASCQGMEDGETV